LNILTEIIIANIIRLSFLKLHDNSKFYIKFEKFEQSLEEL